MGRQSSHSLVRRRADVTSFDRMVASNLLACSPPAHAFGVFVRLRRASDGFGDHPTRRKPHDDHSSTLDRECGEGAQ